MSGAGPTGRLTVVAPGIDLVEGLSEVGGSEGWITGTGRIEDVALRVVADGADTVTNLRGRFNLLTLSGPRGGPFAVTLARLCDAGLQMLGGELVRGRSGGVTVTFLPATRETAPPKGATGAWARTAAASEASAREDEESAEDPTPEAGDLVEHFAFGLCEVLTAEGDRLRIRDVEGPRRVREVALSMLRVTGPTQSDGKKLFQLVRRGAPP
jgi:hypothetical protein